MRIVKLHFKNLNSLVGEWDIDFNDAAFAVDGIFAVSGPTGAGKSTILDAICLALYGRTPRLPRVNKTTNEILSRKTGECFAELSFIVPKGYFRCRWSQRKARGSSEGELQPPQHEIVDAASGAVLETKLRDVADKVEDLTGMNFERFTRSILLAQGEFAVFLQAGADERAPILEQITGTEIYSDISKQVHRRLSEEHRKLDALRLEFSGLSPLSDEEETALQEHLQQQQLKEGDLDRTIGQKEALLRLLESVARLEKDLTIFETRKGGLHARLRAFAPERVRLERAGKALPLARLHAILESQRTEQAKELKTQTESRARLAENERLHNEAQTGLAEAKRQAVTQATARQEATFVLNKVRLLDAALADLRKRETQTAQAVAAGEEYRKQLLRRQEADSFRLREVSAELTETMEQLKATKDDDALLGVPEEAGVSLRALAKNFHRLRELQGEHGRAQAALSAASNASAQRNTEFAATQASLERAEMSLAAEEAALQRALGPYCMDDLRMLLQSATELRHTLDVAVQAAEEYAALEKAEAAQAEQKSALAQQAALPVEHALAADKEQQMCRRELALQEERLLLARQFESLAAHRAHLRDGLPCPLCGALEHPYTMGNAPLPDAALSEVQRAREALRRAEAAFTQAQTLLAEHAAAVKQGAVEAERLRLRRSGLQERIQSLYAQLLQQTGVAAALCAQFEDATTESRSFFDLVAALPLPTAPDTFLSPALRRLPELQAANTRLVQDVQGRIAAARAPLQTVETLRQRLVTEKDRLLSAERTCREAVFAAAQAGESLERAARDTAALLLDIQAELGRLRQTLVPFLADPPVWLSAEVCREEAALEELAAADFESVFTPLLRHLEERLAVRGQLHKRAAELTQERAVLTAALAQMGKEAANLASAADTQKREMSILQVEISARMQERSALFGEKAPEVEEGRLAVLAANSEALLSERRTALSSAMQAMEQVQGRLQLLAVSLQERTLRIEAQEQEFTQSLLSSPFTDEQAFLDACLPEAERQRLADLDAVLARETVELAAAEQEKQTLLDEKRRQLAAAGSDGNDAEAVKDLLAALIRERSELLQAMGAVRQKLRDSEAVRRQQMERIAALRAQEAVSAGWADLHELIGSADGKKYRNFAQGLTLEAVILHANRHLAQMTDRYVLTCERAGPLELNVIDNFQAGEIRSTKNLSGGESFLVSLALALGLSRIAGQNARVDSLFLDEGFGTLDEDALDTALEALAALRQDGKLIGVISHVPALRERIGANIEVVPQSEGRSLLSGPGCRKV